MRIGSVHYAMYFNGFVYLSHFTLDLYDNSHVNVSDSLKAINVYLIIQISFIFEYVLYVYNGVQWKLIFLYSDKCDSLLCEPV